MTDMPRTLALEAARLLDSKKAVNIQVLDVAHLTIVTDYFVIASARNHIAAKAMCDELEEKLGVNPLRRDGYAEGRWIVLDYASVIVHIFHEQEREFYRLERLWEDGSNAITFETEE